MPETLTLVQNDLLAAAASGDPLNAAAVHLEAAATALRKAELVDAVRLLRRGMRLARMAAASTEAPEQYGEAMLEGLDAFQRGWILHQFTGAHAEAESEGCSSEVANQRGADAAAKIMGALALSVADYRGALLQQQWHLDAILTPAAVKYVEALSEVLQYGPVVEYIERGLCLLVRHVDPDAAALSDVDPPPSAGGG